VYVEGTDSIDIAASRRVAAWVDARLRGPNGVRQPRASIDPVNSYFRRLLDCPRQLATMAQTADSIRLDSACNYR